MARLIDAGWWDEFEEGGWGRVDPCSWPTITESDQWDEWIKGGTWVAKRGEDFTTDAEEFIEEVWRRVKEANLSADTQEYSVGSTRYQAAIFRFRYFPTAKKKVLDFSKPLPAHDEETGEYLGFWRMPDGKRVEVPVGVTLVMDDEA